MSGPRLIRAGTIAEAVRLLSESDSPARLIGGGTALQLDWVKGIAAPALLVAIDRIPELAGIDRSGDGWRIGASVTLGRLERQADIGRELPVLAAAVATTAGPAVRSLATFGGNIGGRTGCLIPALLALDAEVEIAGADGEARLPLADWLVRPPAAAPLLTAVRVKSPTPETRWLWRKIGLRAAFSPAVIDTAALWTAENGAFGSLRLAIGGGIVQPTRLTAIEAQLAGTPVDRLDPAGLTAEIEAAIEAPADAFRSAAYRKRAAAAVFAGALTGRSGPLKTRDRSAIEPAAPPSGEIRLGRRELPQRWFVRPDGPEKTAGRLAYLTDQRRDGMLVGRIKRAGIAHARILSIDTSRAEALPGVVAVVTHRDVPGLNAFGIVVTDQPAFCADKVRYAGDAVAAVAAVDVATAERALELIQVIYEPLPVVTDPAAALADNAPQIHDGGNLQRLITFSRGDVGSGFAAAAHVIEATYVTPRQMHGFMETEGGWAEVEPDGTLAVHAGGQHGARDRLQLARILDRPETGIRVVTSPTGGAFGGKDELTVQPALALLTLKAGRPVRIKLSRRESILAGTKRNPMQIRMRTACSADGRLLAQEVDVLADAGAYASLGPGVLETAMEHAGGPYRIANVATRGRLAYTNNGVCGAFRGFGANQMAYALECQMDRLAEACGLTPTEFRRRNLKAPGEPGYLGQQVAPSERLEEMLAAATASPLWQQARGLAEDGDEILGVGMALNYHGNGLGSLVPDPAGGRLTLGPDGRIEAAFGLDEMGQGLLAAIGAIVAAELGLAREDIRPVTGDTALAPDSGSTTASRGTYVVWESARRAGPPFRQALLAAAGRLLNRPAEELRLVPGGIAALDQPDAGPILDLATLAARLAPDERPQAEVAFAYPTTPYLAGNARFLFVFGACIARVAVNRQTGMVRVLDLLQHTAAGPVIDVAAFLGQQEGGAIQGLGFTLSEDLPMRDGWPVTENLDGYMLPSIADAPERMEVHTLERLDPGDPYGPRGAGELGIGAVTPAIANAVADAIGRWPETTPISPEFILQALTDRS